jgi:hypothetical protein
MSERYNVEVEDVLGENYKITNIECSDYNPSIEGNITVTITVNDVYGDAVSGESVTVTASEGTFTQLNGSDITASDSVTGTTNSSGQFTLTYTCSEWGLITFTANNKTTQIKVGGYIQTSLNNGMYTLYEYEDRVGLRIHISTAINFPNALTVINNQHIPHRLAPRYPIMIVCANGISATANTAIGVRESNDLTKTEIIAKSLTGSDISREAYAYLEWDKKY